jgi:hypothetical protein
MLLDVVMVQEFPICEEHLTHNYLGRVNRWRLETNLGEVALGPEPLELESSGIDELSAQLGGAWCTYVDILRRVRRNPIKYHNHLGVVKMRRDSCAALRL